MSDSENLTNQEKSFDPSEVLWDPKLIGNFSIDYLHLDKKTRDYNDLEAHAPDLDERVEVGTEADVKYLYRAAHSKDFVNCIGFYLRNTDPNPNFPYFRTIMGHANPHALQSRLTDSTQRREKYLDQVKSALYQHAKEQPNIPTSLLFITKAGQIPTIPGIVLPEYMQDYEKDDRSFNFIKILTDISFSIRGLTRAFVIALPDKRWYSNQYYRSDGKITMTGRHFTREKIKNESQVFELKDGDWKSINVIENTI